MKPLDIELAARKVQRLAIIFMVGVLIAILLG